jgi:translation initiation factor IF-2
MTKRLVKIAKELNVGTTTIVEYLNSSGFDIENKPTAKVTDEMYEELLKEFQKSKEIAIKANQMIIGRSQQATGKKESTPSESPASSQKPAADKTEKKSAEIEARESAETKKQEKAAEKKEVEKTAKEQPRFKVLGKIDLESRLRSKMGKPDKKEEPDKKAPEKPAEKEKPAAKKEVPEKEEEEKVEAKKKAPVKEKAEKPKAEEEKKAAEKAEKPEKKAPEKPEAKEEKAPEKKKEEPAKAKEEKTAEEVIEVPEAQEDEEKADEDQKKGEEEVVRAEAPELRGLKILGKIDTDKLSRPKKKKKKEKEKEKEKEKSSDESAGSGRRKRRRKRKKVTVESRGRGRGSSRRRSSQKDEVKEVSQKEIEEKIKATMARISGGGSKKKRQRLQRDKRERMREKEEARQAEQETGKLQLTEFISVQDLANLMDVPVTDVITTCMNLGIIVSINQRLDAEVIELVAEEFGHEVEFISVEEQVEDEEEIIDAPEDLEPRAPIVTVMGHVDHGKTSLLDYIREANVASGEAGGITQHIGAYEVPVGDKNKTVTFLDTPGHEAFTAMRARGAKVTDIAIIIIAADDNVMPQTKEAISHAQAAGVPIVFAINKIDKPGADPDRIKQELANMNLLVEDWGGKYQSQDISAKTGQGIDELIEKVALEAELLELKANPDREAIGTVLEASLDKGRGYVTKVLIQTGTLEIGDPIVSGEFSGKVKAMFNERGQRVEEVGPSQPTLVLGLDGAPQAGERFKVVESETEARSIASKRGQIAREQANRATKRISLDEIGRRLALGNFKELNLIVKGDVDGSVEALSDSLIKLSQETVQVNVIHKAVGQIIESDVMLASASDAIIIGFQVRPSGSARRLAEQEGVQIKTYSIIYEAIEEIKLAIEGMLEPTKEEKIVGELEVREIYKISKVGTVAGCYVQDGKLTRNTNVRLVRNGIVIYPTKEGQHGKIASLKRFKDDVKEVKSGFECGVSIENFNDIKVGDIIEGYEIVEIKQTLD